ncbi:hypothetical protein SAMN05428953_104163 [Mesorhizobium muleiense]|uniref:Uncharacterized protein n=1 Tax=Mesorhizobium muleiense TaxID=1004279 RepID=A0A1G8QU64_9HYPH|nr:hypothetical protein SAMN05428953_104163 [Mesorhizobium muleiense]
MFSFVLAVKQALCLTCGIERRAAREDGVADQAAVGNGGLPMLHGGATNGAGSHSPKFRDKIAGVELFNEFLSQNPLRKKSAICDRYLRCFLHLLWIQHYDGQVLFRWTGFVTNGGAGV